MRIKRTIGRGKRGKWDGGLYYHNTSLSFLLQRLCCYSSPRLSWRSRHPDLDLWYNFLLWWTIPFPHTSLYSIVVSLLSILSKSKYLPSSLTYCSLTEEGTLWTVYKPTHVHTLSLASSAHHLLSNLVSYPWSSWLDLSLTDFLSLPTCI